MSQILIQQYLNDLHDLRSVSGTSRESVTRDAFKGLLKGMGRSRDLVFVSEYEIESPARERRYVDGALLHELRVPFGYWEAKDEKDDLDEEIATKFRRGYPQDNIIFEDSREAVLFQHRKEIMRCKVEDVGQLERLLGLYFEYERPEIAEFRKAVAQFKTDLPAVLTALREMIAKAENNTTNPAFAKAARKFLKHAQKTINPSVTDADVREMLIQHILTEDIFSQVFDDTDFHRRNNVAKQLYALEGTFFTGPLKRSTLDALKPYYAAIRSAAALVSSHHEKQAFLKVIYENFYKVYNKKMADRLGVVYTPNEIVRFMIEGADWLCQQNFGKKLIDKGVEILDPAAGTGTFIAELIEHFRGQPEKLKHKYLEELHANEVAILPYYVANLNIEATYAAATQNYLEFPNLCFVDTLDNIAGLRTHAVGKEQHFGDLFGAVSEENVERIQRQNKRKISVIIGNPPYNANQANENDNNKNREYPEIDRRIKETYIAESNAQKTKLYDMYVRFFRWASDRIDENGIVALVTNSSFFHKPSFDGFRKLVTKEFQEIWIVDLKGDARSSGERRRREGGNIFGDEIKVGVSISFLVKRRGASGTRIRYKVVRDYAPADEKVEFLSAATLQSGQFDELRLDGGNYWSKQIANDYANLPPLANKATKGVKTTSQEKAIFKLFSLGISTNRDEWLYDRGLDSLALKVRFLVREYESSTDAQIDSQPTIKWSRNLKRRRLQQRREAFDAHRIVPASYRPFSRRWLYQSSLFVDELGSSAQMFPVGQKNAAICFSDIGSRTDYCVLAVDGLADLHFGAAVDGYQQVPRYRFEAGEKLDNVTDWALQQYGVEYPGLPQNLLTKDHVFSYVYAVLHDPSYREKYALNLKREFPRIPFYLDFARWAKWGEELMSLHIGYESVQPWKLERIDVPDKKSATAGLPPKALLRANKEQGNIVLDSETQLTGIPKEAWDYRLGNRSALEWVLDQHKEKTPKDPTIREKFNTYRFADHKERVIDLLRRVTTVSVETQKIVTAMKEAKGIR